MKHLQAADKIVQQMTRDGAVELNKTTGSAANISVNAAAGARDSPEDSPAENAQNAGADGMYIIGGAAQRVQTERALAKKRAHKKANAEIYKQSQPKPEISRLKFTDAELADPATSKAAGKSKKAIAAYEKAQGKIPKKKSLAIERVSDKPNGKTGTRLTFVESGNKPVNGRLQHALDRPKQEAGAFVHKQIGSHEADNTGVQAAHSTEKAAEGAARKMGAGYRQLKLSPYRSALRHERRAVKANVNALYKRDLRQKPELKKAGALQKAWHKRKIQRDYAKALRAGKTRAQSTAGTVKKAALVIKTIAVKAALLVKLAAVKAAKLAALKVLLPVAALLLILILLMIGISSCGAMFGGFNQIIATSYTAEDEDILGAHGDYTALENQLADRIANIPSEFPGYDEYRFYLDEIGHAPHELTSFLTALYLAFTQAEVQATLQNLFNQQYILTTTSIVEVRTRTETNTGTNPDGSTYSYTVTVQYNWYVLVVTLTNRTIREVAAELLTPEQYEMFLVLLETQGNRPDLFGGGLTEPLGFAALLERAAQPQGAAAPEIRVIPPATLPDSRFSYMMAEAEQFIGFPFVWGGSNPATSFDCSGFVSWVINQSGAGSVGRMTANGLYNHTVTISPAQVRPGDLVFFRGTYNIRGASHVGIYTGGGMMIHAGDPIGFESIRTAYWKRHFKAFTRLP